jgi:hypothetical protein
VPIGLIMAQVEARYALRPSARRIHDRRGHRRSRNVDERPARGAGLYSRTRGVFAGLSSASWIMFAAALVLGYVLRGLFGVTF